MEKIDNFVASYAIKAWEIATGESIQCNPYPQDIKKLMDLFKCACAEWAGIALVDTLNEPPE